ncbi:MAG: hypothetical protein IPI59_10010 [Sphingobacteriales bacterium]|jgi:hypothetical protein|nr:hypothetical protein [Sphingobacteriales bacterium]MBP9142042.1 hypothetical protein [Chitinophagales bacterium]MDA0198160.1 hypothetical protein [Bacteroidota bacterium]MBK6889624.1 hypothetical protein [Sphingobacteriales bacterium]MBK7527865.1 hypothetical protein [Sphingobacteriales bacterium]
MDKIKMQKDKLLKGIAALLLFTMICVPLKAQRYGTCVGLRGGNNGVGITVQHRVLPRTTIEPILNFNLNSASLTVLPQYHIPIIGKWFNYYVGAGPHLGYNYTLGFYGGATAIAGLEWKLPILRIQFSFDVKPAFHLYHPDNKYIGWHTGVSLRYVAISHRDLKKQERANRRANRKGIFKWWLF